MAESFDVFRKDHKGVLWVGAASSLEKAVEHAQNDMREKGECDYIILDARDRTQTVLKAEELCRERSPSLLAKKSLFQLNGEPQREN